MKAIGKAARSTRISRKELPGSMGLDAGFRPLAGFGGAGSTKQAIQAINTYGGTDQASSTIFSCVTLIAETLAGYNYDITLADDTVVEQATLIDAGLFQLLEEPWPEGTYFDWVNDVVTDLMLVGNSLWLCDNMNAFKQPELLRRLTPSAVRVVTNKKGEKIGYTVKVEGIEIPYGLDEVIHYKMPSPLSRHWGMGVVEAILREVQSDLAQNAHVTAFFTNGARIAGVLTVPEGLDDVQFERFKAGVEAEYGSSDAAYKMLIAEKSTGFTPISQPPVASGVVELRKLAKNDILQGFGVPEFLLGGSNEAGGLKMEQAQFIFYRRQLARAKRFQDRTSLSLVSRWEGRKFVVQPEQNEPPEQRTANAKALGQAGGTLNEMREAAGLPLIDDERADVPLILNTLHRLDEDITAAPQLPAGDDTPAEDEDPPTPGQGDDDDPDPERPDEVGDGADEERRAHPLVPPILAPRKKRGMSAIRRAPGVAPAGLPPVTAEGLAAIITDMVLPGGPSARQAFDADSTTVEPLALGPGAPPNAELSLSDLLARVEKAQSEWLEAPELPPGYEQRAPLVDPGEADPVIAQQVLAAQATFFMRATPVIQRAFVVFFNDQRLRMVQGLNDYRSAKARTAADRKALDRDSLWDPDTEKAYLEATYLAVVDELGPQALEALGRIVSADVRWDLQHEHVGAARDRLGALIVRINETTRAAIGDVVEEGMARGLSISQIANGHADEGFKGIQGVFNQATAVRAETIARSETAMIYNAASTTAYRTAGIAQVQVYDGIGDSICAAAAGSVWDVDEAEANPIGHPNCVRAFAPKVEG